MLKVKAEDKKLTIKIYTSIHQNSWWDWEDEDDDNTEGAVKNVSELDKLLKSNKDCNLIDIYINSPGGDCFEGIGIYNILKRHRAYKRVWIDGIAASMASVIAMVGNQINMPKSSMMMIHNCWTCACGNANEFRKLADDLDKINAVNMEAYMTRFNGTKEKLTELLDNESYLTAEECLSYGLCTKIVEDSKETEETVDNALSTITNVYSAKLKQLADIKQSIRSLSEACEPETVKEPAGETVAEGKQANEENDMKAPEAHREMTKEAAEKMVTSAKQNALQRFFHVQTEGKEE